MVDLHAHILPEIDDGPKSLKESCQMYRMAYQDGIRTIVATPHVGKFPNTPEIILNKTKELRQKINVEKLSLNLLCGADFEFHPDLFSFIENKSIFTINNSRYLLLDIPYFLMPPNTESYVARMVDIGIIPIIAHPERCMQIQEDLSILYSIVKKGAIVQITASSITGRMGPKPKQASFLMLKYGLAHIIASDAHGLNKRPPILSEAVKTASNIVGKDAALSMVTTIPQCIVDNKEFIVPKPKKPK